MKTKHTPLPWSWRTHFGTDEQNAMAVKNGLTPVQALTNDGSRFIMSGDGRVALVDCKTEYKRGKGSETHCAERDANADIIVRAVNSHDDLVAAVRRALIRTDENMVTNSKDIDDWKDENRHIGDILRAALAKAKQ